MKKTIAMFSFLVIIIATTGGCDSGSKTPPPSNPSGGTAGTGPELPESLFLKTAPENAKNVGESLTSAKPGDLIVIRGVIGGSEDPFVSHRAIMTIADRKLKSCADMGDEDHCKTPWDYCCEPRDSLKANLATVQVVGADGKVVKTDLKGQGGLEGLRKVVIAGKVAQESSKDSLVINATGVFVEPKG